MLFNKVYKSLYIFYFYTILQDGLILNLGYMRNNDLSNRFARLLAVSSFISERGERGCTLYEIMSLIGVKHRSSAFNLLLTLDEMGFAYYTEMSQDGSRKLLYKIGDREALLWKNRMLGSILSEDDMRLLGFVLESVSSYTPLMELCGKDFLNRIRMVVGHSSDNMLNLRLDGFGPYFKISSGYLKTLLILLEASEKRIKCHMEYESRNSECTIEYDIYPLRVITREGGIYAEVLNNYGLKQFLELSRFRKLEKLGYEQYPMEREDEAFPDPFPFYRDMETFTAKVRVAEYQAWYEIQKAWPESVTFEQEEDGSYIFSIKTSSYYGFQKWVLSMGRGAEVIEPETIRNKIRNEFESMAVKYE